MTPEVLEQRLIDFAVDILKISSTISNTYPGEHLAKQIVRSGTSPALNYAEARAAESANDFVHKVRIVLKELRETLVCLRIIQQADLMKQENNVIKPALKECNELISIFVATTKSMRKRK
jgi:four helix bundle protein